jgi:2-(1,2-epoxy-1,2-dihydrophenyl)acetyl-CoA isomerase
MSDQSYETARVEVDNGVGTITLARPEALNALNLQLKADLAAAIAAIAADERVRVVVLTGEGRAFCAGGDVKEMDAQRSAHEQRARVLKVLQTIALPLARMPKPVVAAVNGPAYGAGFSLALCADVVIASEHAVFSLAFVRVGLIPDLGALYFLPRVVGLNRAKELVFTGAQLTAREAADLGIVNRVVPADEVMSAANELGEELAAGPPVAHALSKRLLDQALHVSLEDMAQLEASAQALAQSAPGHAEGVAAFLDRRKERVGG